MFSEEESLRKEHPVGPEGKLLDYHGVRVEVPKGALDKEITLSMSARKTGPSLEGGQCVSPIIRFECSPKTTFRKPVKVFLPFAGSIRNATSQSKVKLMCGRQGIWRVVKGERKINDSGLSFETKEFGIYTVIGEGKKIAALACFLFGAENQSKTSLSMHIIACVDEPIQKLVRDVLFSNFITGN